MVQVQLLQFQNRFRNEKTKISYPERRRNSSLY